MPAFSGTLVGQESLGALGTVKAGPQVDASGSVWYQVQFDDGALGWDTRDYLTAAAATTTTTKCLTACPSTATCGTISDGCGKTLTCGTCSSGQTCSNNACVGSTTSSGSASWAGILPPSRAVDWRGAGIPGGIPNRTTICANVLTSDTTADIQTKLKNCPANQVVLFPEGTWDLTGSIYSNKPIVIRGAGPTKTFINLPSSGGNILIETAGTNWMGNVPDGLGSTAWTGGLGKGSTVLTLASTAGVKAGQRIVLDQHNASYVFPYGVEGECTSGNSCGRNDNPLQFNAGDSRAQQEMVEIVSVDSATQITIAAPGVAYDHSASLSPQAFYWNTGGAQGPGNITYGGVESLTVNANNNDYAVNLGFCDYCWVKNITVNNAKRTAVFFFWGFHDEARDSYFSTTDTSCGPTRYGIEALQTTFAKIENNIFFNVCSPLLPEGSYGLVAGYNFAYNNMTDNQFSEIETHLAHNYLHLYEGNMLDSIGFDNSWGSTSHNTTFRNRLSGHAPNKTNYREALIITAHSRYENAVGNVLGDPTYHTRYACDQANPQQSDNFIFDLGFFDGCIAGITASFPYDPVVETSLTRWGNWDAVTWNANGHTNGVRWCTSAGVGNAECTANETASADPTFPGLANPSQTLPPSFYLAGKPSWFGGVMWPPIGPDVSCTTNCVANTANHAAEIPAQLCYLNGAKDSMGFLTNFDASTCY
jgi:hypothetical protein